MALVDDNKTLAKRYVIEGFKNPSLLDQITIPDLVVHIPDVTDPIRGRDAVKRAMSDYFNAFPDLDTTVEDILVDGNRVAVFWKSTGTHKGNFQGMAPTGKRIIEKGVTLVRVENGKIVEDRTEYDRLATLQQLGVLPGREGRLDLLDLQRKTMGRESSRPSA